MNDSPQSTPGQMALTVMETIHKELVFKKPAGLPRRRPQMKVLDEDTYVEEIGNIIQRDFFPDLEKTKAQSEYLDALDRNDTIRLRELYVKYSGKKPPSQRMPSPATFETPTNLHPNQDDALFRNQSNQQDSRTEEEKSKRLRLDQYLNSHTSQDNDSFEEILEVANRKREEKYKHLYAIEDTNEEASKTMLALPSVEQQAALPDKPFNINTWGYKNRNYLMYNPDGVEYTKEEEMNILEKRHEIVLENTRLRVNPFNEIRSKETINEMAKTQSKILDGKIGVDGKEVVKSATPRIGGFSLVRTPSPSPSILGTPLMTWGEIEGTPFRLDGSDTPIPRTAGPSFKMSEPPRREQIAIALAEKVKEKNRDQKKRAIDAQRRQFSTPSPRPNTSSVERLATMSPAARKLASSHLRSGFVLSSPQTPTPKRLVTPKRTQTPKLPLGIKRTGDKEVSTDDLLRISLPFRKKASDFF